MMHWKLTRSPEAVAGTTPVGDWLIPFLIDWGETSHPAQNTPTGCKLLEVKAIHPDPAKTEQMFNALKVDCTVEKGEAPRLIAVIDTPNGQVQLT